MRNDLSRQAGLTLVELLVGMALFGLLMTVLYQTLSSATDGTGRLTSQGLLQQEALNGQAVIASRLKEAWYVYPGGSTLNFANNTLIRNPSTNTSSFTVGTQPVLAMILPPRASGATCTPNTANNSGCYRFYAYYGMKRSDWVTAATGFKDPGAEPTGVPATWIIAEYQADYVTRPTVSATAPAIPPTASDNSRINLLAESVAPALGGASPAYQLFTLSTTSTGMGGQVPGWPTSYVNKVQFDLRVTQTYQGRTSTLPNASSAYTLVIYPENVGRDGI